MSYKISMVIPVYNAENTISSAIDSVINQTLGFENIELILIDDGSSDRSKEIIQIYAGKYENIKPVFLKQNSGGASHPRNVGIENSTADYLIFMDSDDEIFKDYCEILLDTITKNDNQIVNCNHSTNLNGSIFIPNSIETINNNEKVCDNTEKMFLKHTAWGNIYSSSLIKENNIKFPNTLHEDGVFSIHCLLKTNKPVIRLPNYPGYVYNIDDNESLSHNICLNSMELFLKGYALCAELLESHGRSDVEPRILSSFVNMAIFILIKLDDLDNGMRLLYEFEKSLDFEITLNSKPLALVNSKIMKKQFMQAKLLLKTMGLFYNNKRIKNYIFINYSNLKLLE